MSNIQAEDDFIYGNPTTTSARQASWENQLLDDFEAAYDFRRDTRTSVLTDPLVNHNPVDNPSHYNSGNIECIEAIEEALTDEELRGYFEGNCLKYLWREQYKNQLEDLKKAKWYLDRLVSNVEDGRDN